MDQEKFNRIVDDLNKFSGVNDVYLLGSDGKVIFKSGVLDLTIEEARTILKAWKEKEPSLTYQNFRYAILKNDDIQLAAKNIVGDKGNIAGSITKEGDYLLIHTDSETEMILLTLFQRQIGLNQFY
jgi:regulatory protein YycH of two-component signal transduction system YycFG